MKKKFEENVIGITGYSYSQPTLNEGVMRIIELEGGKLVGENQPVEDQEVGDIIVIGDLDFDEDYIKKSIEIGIERNFICRYFSLEDFWYYWLDDVEMCEPYFEGDPRVKKHAGLSFLASLYFDYPTVDIFNFGERNQNNANGWNTESILRADFGYTVRKGTTLMHRKNALSNAVKTSNKISLKEIAEHLAFLINTRKGIKSLNSAVERWLEDLSWLREEFYDKSIHSFRFPNPN